MELGNHFSCSKMLFSRSAFIICIATFMLGIISCSKQNDVNTYNSSKEILIPKHNIKIGLLIEEEEFCFTVIKSNRQILYHRIDAKTGETSNSIAFFDANGVANEIWDFNGDGFPDHKIIGTANESLHYAYIDNEFQKIEFVNEHRVVNGKQIEFKDGRYQFM